MIYDDINHYLIAFGKPAGHRRWPQGSLMCTGGGGGWTWFTRSKNAQQENKGTSTSQEQKQEQHLPIRHAGRPADSESRTSFEFMDLWWILNCIDLNGNVCQRHFEIFRSWAVHGQSVCSRVSPWGLCPGLARLRRPPSIPMSMCLGSWRLLEGKSFL